MARKTRTKLEGDASGPVAVAGWTSVPSHALRGPLDNVAGRFTMVRSCGDQTAAQDTLASQRGYLRGPPPSVHVTVARSHADPLPADPPGASSTSTDTFANGAERRSAVTPSGLRTLVVMLTADLNVRGTLFQRGVRAEGNDQPKVGTLLDNSKCVQRAPRYMVPDS